MKLSISILIALIMLSGCRTSKKVTESEIETIDKTEVTQKADTKEEIKVDSDKTSYKKTTITEIEYFIPESPVSETATTNPAVTPVEQKTTVKLTKVTIIEEGTKDNSKTEVIKTDNSKISTKTEDKTKSETQVSEKKKTPVQWWAIFGILAIAAVGFIYFQVSGRFSFVSKIFKS